MSFGVSQNIPLLWNQESVFVASVWKDEPSFICLNASCMLDLAAVCVVIFRKEKKTLSGIILDWK